MQGMLLDVRVRFGNKLHPAAIKDMFGAVQVGVALGRIIRDRVIKDAANAKGQEFGRIKSVIRWFPPNFPRKGKALWRDKDGSTRRNAKEYYEALHGDNRIRGYVTGAMWDSLTVSVANSKNVWIFFGKSGPAYPGRKARKLANKIKARAVQRAANAPLLEPSQTELRAVLNAFRDYASRHLLAERLATGQQPLRLQTPRRSVSVWPSESQV